MFLSVHLHLCVPRHIVGAQKPPAESCYRAKGTLFLVTPGAPGHGSQLLRWFQEPPGDTPSPAPDPTWHLQGGAR